MLAVIIETSPNPKLPIMISKLLNGSFILIILGTSIACHNPNANDRSSDPADPDPPENTGTEKVIPVPVDTLLTWRQLGIGSLDTLPDGEVLSMTNIPGSYGYSLLSQKRFGPNVKLNFKAKAMEEEGVGFILLSAFAGQEFFEVSKAANDWLYWQDSVNNYIVTWHVGYHNKQGLSYLRKDTGSHIIARGTDLAEQEKWYAFEFGQMGDSLWYKVNDTLVLDTIVTDPLGPGYLGFRGVGPPTGPSTENFTILYKDVVITQYE